MMWNFIEEGVFEGCNQGDPFRRIILQHLLDQIEQLVVVFNVSHPVFLEIKKKFVLLLTISLLDQACTTNVDRGSF